MGSINVQQRNFFVKAGMTVEDVQNSAKATDLQKKYVSSFDTLKDNDIQFKTNDEVKPYTAIQSKNASTNTAAKKNSKADHDIECYKSCIEICEKRKSTLLETLKTGNYSEQQRMYATEAKHPIAMGFAYTGAIISGLGMSTAILGFMNPGALVGGIAAALVGAAIAGISKGIIVNGDIKNTTEKDMQNYIKSEISKLDKKIANYKEEIKQLKNGG